MTSERRDLHAKKGRKTNLVKLTPRKNLLVRERGPSGPHLGRIH